MDNRPTSRVPDNQIRKRAAVVYHDFGSRTAPSLQAVAAYVEPRRNGMHVVRVLGCHVRTHHHQIIIGGARHTTCFKNAAAGRRLCPSCWDPQRPAGVHDTGPHAGHCVRCGAVVDQLLTSLRPYFYYFHDNSQHQTEIISGRSPLTHVADQLKTALLLATTVRETPVLPTLTADGIDCELDTVTVFGCNHHDGLKGVAANVRYNFWSHSRRQAQHEQRTEFLRRRHR